VAASIVVSSSSEVRKSSGVCGATGKAGCVIDGEVADVGRDDDGCADSDRGGEDVAVLRVVGHVRLVRGDLGLGDEASRAGLLERIGDACERAVDSRRPGFSERCDVALDQVASSLVEDARGQCSSKRPARACHTSKLRVWRR